MNTLELPSGVAEQLRREPCPECYRYTSSYDCPNNHIARGERLVLPQVVVAKEELTVECPTCGGTKHRLTGFGGRTWEVMCENAYDDLKTCRNTGRVPFSEGTVRLTTTACEYCDSPLERCEAARVEQRKCCPDCRHSRTLADCVGVKQYDRDKVIRSQLDHDGSEMHAAREHLFIPRGIFDALPPGPKVLLITEPPHMLYSHGVGSVEYESTGEG